MDFVNLMKNVVQIFFDQREITTSHFYDLLVKLHKGYETTEGSLGGPRTQILAKIVAFNNTLTTLHLSRKNI